MVARREQYNAGDDEVRWKHDGEDLGMGRKFAALHRQIQARARLCNHVRQCATACTSRLQRCQRCHPWSSRSSSSVNQITIQCGLPAPPTHWGCALALGRYLASPECSSPALAILAFLCLCSTCSKASRHGRVLLAQARLRHHSLSNGRRVRLDALKADHGDTGLAPLKPHQVFHDYL